MKLSKYLCLSAGLALILLLAEGRPSWAICQNSACNDVVQSCPTGCQYEFVEQFPCCCTIAGGGCCQYTCVKENCVGTGCTGFVVSAINGVSYPSGCCNAQTNKCNVPV